LVEVVVYKVMPAEAGIQLIKGGWTPVFTRKGQAVVVSR
jgi:hypothetical protein